MNIDKMVYVMDKALATEFTEASEKFKAIQERIV